MLQRSRALDNQIFVATCSPARDTLANYVAYGHSGIVNPDGQFMVQAKEEESIIYADIDPEFMKECQTSIPINNQRRFDVYPSLLY